ncbi:MAG: Rrf2 family transcriptional regulator [Bryobacteraceae bacterium]|jgi:Rrf2 family protein
MLKLTKKADYGLIALRHLALHHDGASAKEIAACYGIPMPLLAKVLQKLARGGLLTAAYGTRGGYKLARDAKSISALEAIRAIDGPVLLTSCFTRQGECGQSSHCGVREPLRKIHESLLGLLGDITIADMADEAERSAVEQPPVQEPPRERSLLSGPAASAPRARGHAAGAGLTVIEKL